MTFFLEADEASFRENIDEHIDTMFDIADTLTEKTFELGEELPAHFLVSSIVQALAQMIVAVSNPDDALEVSCDAAEELIDMVSRISNQRRH
jgi:hypothetical protein